MNYKEIKNKQREIRDGFSPDLGLRVHRAISWLGKAESTHDDFDAKFIFLWISFNAAYAKDIDHEVSKYLGERDHFHRFFEKLVALDATSSIYKEVWNAYPGAVRGLMNNQFVFHPFWEFQNEHSTENWEERFNASKKVFNKAFASNDVPQVLSLLFDRLYVLRNQIMHGGATWNGKVNREQLRDGSGILSALIPIFIDLMMDNPQVNWGEPFYPVVSV